jgi:hypothetical protein
VDFYAHTAEDERGNPLPEAKSSATREKRNRMLPTARRLPVLRGAVFHADSKRRREVEFTAELRQSTEAAVAQLQALLKQSQDAALPASVLKPACEECSLYEICLPRVTSQPARLVKAAAALFEI